MQALGYSIEDGIFALWAVLLTLAVIRNIHHERTYINKKEPSSLVRRTNKGAVAFMCVVYALAPDFRATRGIYGSSSAEFDLLYGYLAVCLLFASCVFIFSTLQAARVATSKTLHLPPESGFWKFYKYMHFFFPGVAFVVVTVAVALGQYYGTDVPIGIWHIVVCVIVLWEIVIFLWYSIKLQRAIAHYKDTLYTRLYRSLRVYQFVITVPATILVLGLAYFVPDNLASARREERSEEDYNYSWALWMWCALLLESGFIFIAWVRPHHHSHDMHHHKRAASEMNGSDEEAKKRRSRQFSSGSTLLISPTHKRGGSLPPSVAEGSEVEFFQANLAASPSNHSITNADTTTTRHSTSEDRLNDPMRTIVVTIQHQTDGTITTQAL